MICLKARSPTSPGFFASITAFLHLFYYASDEILWIWGCGVYILWGIPFIFINFGDRILSPVAVVITRILDIGPPQTTPGSGLIDGAVWMDPNPPGEPGLGYLHPLSTLPA